MIAKAIATELGKLDPANQARYAANLAAFEGKVNALDKVIAVQMEAVDQKGYFVFHEAYGYWERHYGMSSKGHFTVSPERRPGAKTLIDIRKALEEKKASCIYAEPQFSPAVIESVARNTGARCCCWTKSASRCRSVRTVIRNSCSSWRTPSPSAARPCPTLTIEAARPTILTSSI